jgi:glycosyltransferase involved in cell wall biosynthesis
MKILLVSKYYFVKGGAERAMFAQKELLEAHGHDVAVFSMQDSRNEESAYAQYFVPNVNFGKLIGVLSAIGNIFSLKHYFLFKKLLADFKPDVIHLHNVFFQISPSILIAARQAGIPVVATAHDYQWVSPDYRLLNGNTPHIWTQVKDFWKIILNRTVKGSFFYSLFTVLAHLFMRILNMPYSYVSAFVAPSKFMGNTLTTHGYKDTPVHHVPYYLTKEEFAYSGERTRDYMLFVGRFSYEKGIHTLIEVLKSMPEVRAKIVGAGPLGPQIKKSIEGHDHIELIGFTKSKSKLRDLMGNALCTVVPSEWYENYPLTILESFAAGTPVIVSDIGGLPEMALKNQTGDVFKAGSVTALRKALQNAWQNKDTYDGMSSNCIAYIDSKCSAEVAYKAMMDIYTKL